MLADAAFLLFITVALVAKECGVAPASLWSLHLATVIAVCAVYFSNAGLSLLHLFSLLCRDANRWTELARRWMGFKVVVSGWAVFLTLGGVLLVASLECFNTRLDSQPRSDREHRISMIVCDVCLAGIYLLFSVLAVIPIVSAMHAAIVVHFTQKSGSQRDFTVRVANATLLKARLIRLAVVITIFVTAPGAILYAIHYAVLDECGFYRHYRLICWGASFQQLLCLGRVVVDGLLDVRENGEAWSRLVSA